METHLWVKISKLRQNQKCLRKKIGYQAVNVAVLDIFKWSLMVLQPKSHLSTHRVQCQGEE